MNEGRSEAQAKRSFSVSLREPARSRQASALTQNKSADY